ncbi:hypothetical protein [Streptomyces sp. NPDC060194]|uniref:hypothetical protein n=1 Tax=Streptomyces sp. NPDC060194 TaxID=3347069 RepID=UPI00364B266C
MSDPNQNPYAGDSGAYGYPGGDQGQYGWGPGKQPPQPPGYGYPAPAYGPPAGGYGYPQDAGYPVPAAGGAPQVAIGDISVVGDQILTPSGPMPLRGAVWNAVDMSRTEEKMPAVAIVLAVLFFFVCFLGLLFLLMKEKTTTGYIQVTVTSAGRTHQTMIPATGPDSFAWVMAQVNYARTLSL